MLNNFKLFLSSFKLLFSFFKKHLLSTPDFNISGDENVILSNSTTNITLDKSIKIGDGNTFNNNDYSTNIEIHNEGTSTSSSKPDFPLGIFLWIIGLLFLHIFSFFIMPNFYILKPLATFFILFPILSNFHAFSQSSKNVLDNIMFFSVLILMLINIFLIYYSLGDSQLIPQVSDAMELYHSYFVRFAHLVYMILFPIYILIIYAKFMLNAEYNQIKYVNIAKPTICFSILALAINYIDLIIIHCFNLLRILLSHILPYL